MILTALHELYRRLSAGDGPDALPPLGFALTKVVGAVVLDREGRFQDILDLRTTDGKRQVPRLIQVPQPPQRTVKVVPGFLCDNAGYLCGHDGKGKPERARTQFEAARELHERLLAGLDHPAARAIRAHFAGWDPAEAAERLAAHEDLVDGWLVFQVLDLPGGEPFVHDVPALREAWARHVAAAEAGAEGQCLVTGEIGPIARLHAPIKGVQGAQTSGASLVSFNIAAATSYGKDQSFNAPVGEAAAFGYTTALNHLLRREMRQSLTIGDTTTVFWAEKASAAETLIPALVDPAWREWEELIAEAAADDLEAARADRLRGLLVALRDGRRVTDPDLLNDAAVRFHVLGLAPNAARLSVRFWDVAPVGEMLRRLGEHHQDLALDLDHPNRPPSPSLWALAQETRPKDRDGKARGTNSLDTMKKLHGDIARAVLTGGPYPQTLPALLLARFRADGWVTHPRVALLKAEYNRRRRFAGQPEDMIPMSLDPARTEVGYRLGRLFAVLERIQEAAHGGSVNAGIGQKFLSSASGTPMAVFPHLLRLKGAHLKKVARDGRGLSVWYDRLVAEILDEVRAIPASLTPDHQGLFFLGYYQQRQALFRKGETPAAEVSDADTDTAA
ncbi:type I-C CRISPR-associated protein Cas8c/Csd1 [Caenispirillum bisanense]|uniref:type I-C CRISPR-associated protein Cas8c/Csd1 n=1 Tax=Caenispirillum bisanense TaxID=414052 RepID=UPI0031D89A6D